MADRWRNSGNSDKFYFLGLQNYRRQWLQPQNKKILAPWKKRYDKPRQHITKQRYHFANKALHTQSYGISIVMYKCDSWTIKKAKGQRIDGFEMQCWRRLLRVPWTVWRSNQSILKEIPVNIHWKDWCWRWSSNTLATLFEELTHQKRPWCWEKLKAGGERDNRG